MTKLSYYSNVNYEQGHNSIQGDSIQIEKLKHQ